MMRGSTIAGLAMVVAAITAACGSSTPAPTSNPIGSPLTAKKQLMADFDRNLALWQASGITRYGFTFTPSCFCNTTPHLVVADDDAIRIDGAEPNQQTNAPAGVPGLFEMARRAINGDHATIWYDGATGVPISLKSDPISNAVDDEYAFQVTRWTLEPVDDHVLRSVSTARRLWDRQGLQTYAWSMTIVCTCFHDGRRYDITVKDNDPIVRFNGKQVDLIDLDGVPTMVPAFFDLITEWAVAGATDATFDDARGYPTRVQIHAANLAGIGPETITVVSFAVP
jgi:hypothetical protein